jgi:hypothetical protein
MPERIIDIPPADFDEILDPKVAVAINEHGLTRFELIQALERGAPKGSSLELTDLQRQALKLALEGKGVAEVARGIQKSHASGKNAVFGALSKLIKSVNMLKAHNP